MDIYSILFLIAGIYLLIKGADLFVDGSSNIARFFKIPSLIIGLTLVSIGTSLPELSVSITASLNGSNEISFGNVIGSNIFNILIVVGASSLFVPLTISKSMKKYDLPILLLIYLVLALFCFVTTPLIINTLEAIIILVLFVLYLVFLILRSIKENKNQNDNEIIESETKKETKPMYLNIGYIILGFILIVSGGELVVNGASDIAKEICNLIGITDQSKIDLLIGLTVVSVGTSLPELVTSIVAAKKGENDIAIGNAVGSCIFNVLLILGTAATIVEMQIANNTFIDVIVMFIAALLIFIFSFKKLRINKIQGLVMIILYVMYLAYTITLAFAF